MYEYLVLYILPLDINSLARYLAFARDRLALPKALRRLSQVLLGWVL